MMKTSTTGLFSLFLVFLLSALLPGYAPAQAFRTSDPPLSPDDASPTFLYLPVLNRQFPLASIFGVESLDLVKDFGFARDYGLVEIQSTQAYWLRRNGVLWSEIEPNPGERRWENLRALDEFLSQVSKRRMQTILIVRSAPEWAQKYPGMTCGPIDEAELDRFAAFMHDLVKRYSGPSYNVKYWEIGNEPDAPINNGDMPYGCWGEVGDPYYGGSYYAVMLERVYHQIKAADPEAQVLVGGLLLDCDPDHPPESPPGSGVYKDCTMGRFLEGILAAGGGEHFDGVSFHAYDYYYGSLHQFGNPNWHSTSSTTGPSLTAKVAFLRSVLAQYGTEDKYLLNTETALLCDQGCDEAYERTKAAFLVKAYTEAIRLDLHANIWYEVFGVWRNSGLLHLDSSKRPAYFAFQTLIKLLGDSRFEREIPDVPGARIYQFSAPGQTIQVAWSISGGPVPYAPASLPAEIFNYAGAPQAIMNITLSAEPFILVWKH